MYIVVTLCILSVWSVWSFLMLKGSIEIKFWYRLFQVNEIQYMYNLSETVHTDINFVGSVNNKYLRLSFFRSSPYLHVYLVTLDF